MGQSSRARREARRRSHPRAARVGPRPSAGAARAEISRAEILALIDQALRYAVAAPHSAGLRIDLLNEIGAAAPGREQDPAGHVVDEVLARIGGAWENGWQPQDLVHVARRRASVAVATWIRRAVIVEAGRAGALDRAPEAWSDQIAALTKRRDRVDGPDTLLSPGGRATGSDWTIALVALDLLRGLPRSQVLVPPPSLWGQAQPPRSTAPRPGGPASKTLTKIRALLAKAESTEFTAEAEAFTAKAQDLMTRHAIDEALLADGAGGSVEVRGVRVLIHHPYALEKAGLLNVIAKANRTRAVWFEFGSSVTLVGVPTDVEQVEMLFTSMLVQATKALTRAGDGPGSRGSDRSSAFRRAFLSAYAARIGERLTASTEKAAATYGTDLVPVFQRQGEAVEGEFERLFPHVTTGSRRVQLDLRGWEAGTAAAEEAILPAGMVES